MSDEQLRDALRGLVDAFARPWPGGYIVADDGLRCAVCGGRWLHQMPERHRPSCPVYQARLALGDVVAIDEHAAKLYGEQGRADA